jgi:hypothetical protein
LRNWLQQQVNILAGFHDLRLPCLSRFVQLYQAVERSAVAPFKATGS